MHRFVGETTLIKHSRFKSFKTFLKENRSLEEGTLRKGAVAAFGLKGRRHGDDAFRSWQSAQSRIKRMTSNSELDDRLLSSLADLLDGLMHSRKQLGSISAQITASDVLSQKGRR